LRKKEGRTRTRAKRGLFNYSRKKEGAARKTGGVGRQEVKPPRKGGGGSVTPAEGRNVGVEREGERKAIKMEMDSWKKFDHRAVRNRNAQFRGEGKIIHTTAPSQPTPPDPQKGKGFFFDACGEKENGGAKKRDSRRVKCQTPKGRELPGGKGTPRKEERQKREKGERSGSRPTFLQRKEKKTLFFYSR